MKIDYEPATASTGIAVKRDLKQAMTRGLFGRCPQCGTGKLFSKYLKVADTCSTCSEELHHHRADDAPPYFTIFIVGHIVIPLVLLAEYDWRPDIWVHMAIWLPLAVILTLVFLPLVKGTIVGFQWAIRMHGFEYSAICTPKQQTRDTS